MSENFIGRNNAKWDDNLHIIFVELCEQEIRKGNRPNTYLSKQGWKIMLMKGETGLGWDENKKTIVADDDWRMLNTKNLGIKISLLYGFRYDAIFADIVATGERARAASQEQISGIGLDLDDEINNFYSYDQGDQFGSLNDEKSDDSNDI
ncbi:uncharacterized protein LOC142161941 [Nicotiana tabacum]|uniref:Uncharacterized protein LOC142161941 n=1 Tax=Nicotiana tabacum TaxID=4097 RepID=A0AC58RNG5_TOBAC